MCNTISQDQLIHQDETLEDLQLNGLRIIQKKTGFRFGIDSVILADFAQIRSSDHVADFGTGSGILPLLLAGRGKAAFYDAFEIQPALADLAQRNVSLNQLQDRIFIHLLSAEDAVTVLANNSLDAVICNPPYGLCGAARHCESATQDISRNQAESGLFSWMKAAHQLLRGKARISIVYPAPRMLQMMDLLRQAHLEPKRFRLVYPRADLPARLVLIDAVKDGRPMLVPEPPLILNGSDGRMTPELKRIYHL